MTRSKRDLEHLLLPNELGAHVLSFTQRDQIADALRCHTDLREAVKLVGRPLYGVIIREKNFEACQLPLYMVEEPHMCEEAIAEMFQDGGIDRDFLTPKVTPKVVAYIVNNRELLKSKVPLLTLCCLILVAADAKLREMILSVDQTKYDPVLVIYPLQLRDFCTQFTMVMRLPINAGALQNVDAS